VADWRDKEARANAVTTELHHADGVYRETSTASPTTT
jgi:hypothetical protein